MFQESGEHAVDPVVLDQVRVLANDGVTIVGMGRKVQRTLERAGIPHRSLVHPAARGAIRVRALDQAHVASVLRRESHVEVKSMSLISVPFDLPPAFLDRLGYRSERRLIAVFFEPGIDEVAFTDGIRGLVGADHYVYWELTRQLRVEAWLTEHRVHLGNSDRPATHWLLIDRATECVYVCDVPSARDRVRTQSLEDWVG